MYTRWQTKGKPLSFARAVGVLAVGLGLCGGCDGSADSPRSSGASTFESLCVSAGICDEAPAPPEIVDILCDASLGSSCNRENVRAVIDTVARFTGPRSGSRTRLWAMGPTVAESHLVGELVAPMLSARTRTRRAQLERFAAHAQSTFSLALEPAFTRPGVHRSPLIESLTKVALADGYGLPRRVIVISHAREFSSVRDFACAPLPTDIEFARVLRRRGLLAPGSLAHVEIVFAFVTSAPIGAARCALHMDRELQIRELWRTALTRAGASEVRFDSGAPVLVGDRPPTSPTTTTTTTRRTTP